MLLNSWMRERSKVQTQVFFEVGDEGQVVPRAKSQVTCAEEQRQWVTADFLRKFGWEDRSWEGNVASYSNLFFLKMRGVSIEMKMGMIW